MHEWNEWNERTNDWMNEWMKWMNEWKWNEMKRNEMKRNETKRNEMKWKEMKEMNEWNEWMKWMNEMNEMNEWINQSINESMNQWINESMNRWINQSINESTNQWINETCRPHLLKVIWTPQCVNMFMWNRALATVLCTFCRQLLQIEARDHGNRPYFATTEATLPEKTPGFAPGSLFKPEFTPFSCIFGSLV